MPLPPARTIQASRSAAKSMADCSTPFIYQMWYVAAFSDEIGRHLLSRTILGKQLVFYRKLDGQAVAMDNRCAHRSFPLSNSTLDGDTIICGYHGMRYDPTGKCTEVPSQDQVPPNIGVRAYPLVEDGPIIWIWMGDPDKADPEKIPVQDWMDNDQWTASKDYLHMKASYVPLHENLLDLTHLSFLHADTFGTPDYAKAPFESEIDLDQGRFALTRSVVPTRLPPLWAKPTGLEDVDAARIIRSEFVSPAMHIVNVKFYRAGLKEDERPDYQIKTAHIPTPETNNTTHYFFYHARNFALNDESITEFMHENLKMAFMEDVDGLEAIDSLLANHDGEDFYEISVGSDKASVAMRRYLKKLASLNSD